MSQMRPPGGSRFLYEPFDYGPAKVIEANEKILELKFASLDLRMNRLDVLMERLERRLWLVVYGVAATVLATGVKTLMTITQGGG